MHAALLVASSSLHDMITWYSKEASGPVESHSKLHNISLYELVLVGGLMGGQMDSIVQRFLTSGRYITRSTDRGLTCSNVSKSLVEQVSRPKKSKFYSPMWKSGRPGLLY